MRPGTPPPWKTANGPFPGPFAVLIEVHQEVVDAWHRAVAVSLTSTQRHSSAGSVTGLSLLYLVRVVT